MSREKDAKRPEEAVAYIFLWVFASNDIRAAEMVPLHRAYRIMLSSLKARKPREGEESKLPRLRIDQDIEAGRNNDLDRALENLSKEKLLEVGWDGESEKVTFYPSEENREIHTARKIECKLTKLHEFSSADRAILIDFARKAINTYKGLRRSCCD